MDDMGNDELETLAQDDEALTDPSIRRTNASVKLLDLPFEVLERIFVPIIDEAIRSNQSNGRKEVVSLLMSRMSYAPRFCHGHFPEVFERLRGIIKFNLWLTKNFLGPLIGSKIDFVNTHMQDLYVLPDIFGRANCRCITNLSITGQHAVTKFPPFLETIAHLPNLKRLELHNWTLNNETIHAELLHIMSFVIRDCHKLHRVVVPADSGSYYSENSPYCSKLTCDFYLIAEQAFDRRPGDTRREWKTHKHYNDREFTQEVICTVRPSLLGGCPITNMLQDEVLEITTIRRMLRKEVKKLKSIDQFVIKPVQGQTKDDICTSELKPDPAKKFFRVFEQRAYKTEETHRAMGWKKRWEDQMVRYARKMRNEAQARSEVKASKNMKG